MTQSTSDERIQKLVRLPESMCLTFDKLYPQYGSWTWFVESALRHFLELHTFSPDDLVAEAAEQMLANLDADDPDGADTDIPS